MSEAEKPPTGAPPPASKGCVSDEELVARAREGDDDAFGELVDRHRHAVYRAALAALGSAADADDVAQEAFLAAHRALAGFRAEASFRTWMLAIAWRCALSRRRSVRSWMRRFVSGDELHEAGWDPAHPGPRPDGSLLDRELAGHVEALVDRLPHRLRDALLLQATGDHTYAEIGRMLGVAEGTIKFRVSEARRRVKERLVRMGYGDE